MKNYVLASVTHSQFNDSVYVTYYEGLINGEYWYSDVTEAMRFDFEELYEYLKSHSQLMFLGFCVVRIEDCTFEILKTNEELVRKFSKVEHALR